MPHKSRVSVIVPIYNVDSFLDQCLASLQAQSLADIEVICINDGSTDTSLSIIERYVDADERFCVIDKPNEGYGASCNRGIEAACGEYISVIEPDDYIEPDMYEEMLVLADSFSETVDIVKTPWFDVVDWDTPETLQDRPSYLYGRLHTSIAPFTINEAPILLETHPSIWSALYRREFLEREQIRFRPFPGAGWADNPFLIDSMLKAKSIVFLNKMFYHYRTDLPKTARANTAPTELLAMRRWLEMADQLEVLQVADKNIWAAHYLRAFNYLDVLAEEYELDALAEHDLVTQVFARMDVDDVLNIKKLSPQKQEFFLKLRKENSRKPRSLPYIGYLIREFLHRVKTYGFAHAFRSITNRPQGFA